MAYLQRYGCREIYQGEGTVTKKQESHGLSQRSSVEGQSSQRKSCREGFGGIPTRTFLFSLPLISRGGLPRVHNTMEAREQKTFTWFIQVNLWRVTPGGNIQREIPGTVFYNQVKSCIILSWSGGTSVQLCLNFSIYRSFDFFPQFCSSAYKFIPK